MRKRYILVIALITALLITGVTFTVLSQKPTQTAPETPTAQVTKPLNADTIFELVNQEREKAGLQPLVRDARLDATAQARADDMVVRGYFSHNDPITGENLVNILNGQKQCAISSENIGQTYSNPDDNIKQVSNWMNSKAHHDAILSTEYDITGVAVNGIKVVQHFCNLK